MLASPLVALLLAGGAPPLVAFESRTCPMGPAASDAAEHAALASRADCFRAAMEGAATGETGLVAAAQADYAAWAAAACRLTETLVWTDLDARRRKEGSRAGLGLMLCLASAFGERAFFLADAQAFEPVLSERQSSGAMIRVLLARLLATARDDAKLPPPKGPRALGPKELRAVVGSIDQVWAGAIDVAHAQCGALGTPSSLCVSR
ncbi:MAG: hypothetical protein ACYCWW_15910, partial [Deltaproteobacteria bacterium]